MTKKVSEEELKEVANLAQIKLTDKEVVQYSKDLGDILSYFDKLQEINTQDLCEIGHITGISNVYRKEDLAEEISREEKEMILSSVPKKNGRYIQVKNVL